MVSSLFLLVTGSATGFFVYRKITGELPRINSLRDYRPSIVSTVFSDDGTKIGEFYKERRILIPLSEMPENLKNAFVAAEDSRFREHVGVDPMGIVRAFIKNLQAGTIVQGGSTITQQVTKSFFLTPERTYERKLKEAILAYRIDKNFTKDEILYLYLNQIYLGHGAHGVEAAAQNYFGKHAKDMNLAECSMIAGLPQAPSRYSPFRNKERARRRQHYVLTRMHEDGYITQGEISKAMDTNLDIRPRKNWFMESVPCYTEHVRRYALEKYGGEMLYRNGLEIHTGVDIGLQKIARKAVINGLGDLDKRQGYRGPVKNISSPDIDEYLENQARELPSLGEGMIYEGVVSKVDDTSKSTTVLVGRHTGTIDVKDIHWARKPNPDVAFGIVKIQRPSQVFHVGDVILVKALELDGESGKWNFSLEQEPDVEAALLSIEVGTGIVKAMIGGRDYTNSQFNRAIQSRRQPGSAFKPVIFAAALDKGYTAASTIIDSPIVYDDSSKELWKPHNYSQEFYGPTLLREALAKSRNVVTIKIVQDIGIDHVIDYAHRLGIQSPIGRNLSVSLGALNISLLELVNTYSVFANDGYFVEPVFITKIVDRDGITLEQSSLRHTRVLDRDTAYIMTSLMESVVKSGTGRRVKALGRPVAGKTGTTNNLHDALFIGYTPEYTTGVWVGFDMEISLGKGETGARAASPIWLEYMQGALEDRPIKNFTVPEGIVFAKVDARTGLLPSDASGEIILECFKDGTVPDRHTPTEDSVTGTEDLFKSDI
ncbi:MAG: PBP1A family penicillin-binding protein [Desulfamplus sp.]|nr:PBP1A family penicillin-binding protein [Desulfamplus sp.]